MSPMRFCMVSAFYPPESFGGDAIFIERLSHELLVRGHGVDVIYCADSYRALGGKAGRAAESFDGLTIHRLESGFGTLAPLAAHQAGRPLLHRRAVRRILQSKRFDVVHFHNISVFGPGVLTIPGPPGSLKLYTAHEHWLVCPLSVLWRNNEELCRKPTCTSCMLHAGRPPQLWRHTALLERCAQSVDAFFALSEASAKAHQERGFASRMRLLPNFVSPPEAPIPQAPHPRPYCLFVGRLEKYKGLQDVIPLFAGAGDYDLLILGRGGYEQELRRLAQGSPRVHFTGWIAADRLGAYYQHARALIAASLTYETFGMVVVEAMARGTPVIARELGAYSELIGASRGGLLFHDVESLSDCLHRIGAEDQLRARLSESARIAYAKYWTPETHVDHYLQAIDDIRKSKVREQRDSCTAGQNRLA